MWMNDELYRRGRTRTFKQIFPQSHFYDKDSDEEVQDETNFRWLYENCGLPCKIGDTRTVPSTDTIKIIYILLLGRYGEARIAGSNESKFRLEVMSRIFQYAPLWEKQLALQDEIRKLKFSDLLTGSKVVRGHAYNPSTVVDVDDIMEDSTVPLNEANITLFKRNPSDVYNDLMALLDRDHTNEFLNKFKNLFAQFPYEVPLTYWNCEEDDDNEE